MKYFEPNDSAVAPILAIIGAKTKRAVRVRTIAHPYEYHVSSYWDGGSKTDYYFIQMATGKVLTADDLPRGVRQQAANPYSLPIADVQIPEGVIIIEHIFSAGKDMGYAIICRDDNTLAALEPAPTDLTDREKQVLRIIRSYKSSYRREEYARAGISTQELTDTLNSLKGKGMIDARGAVTVKGRNAAV